MPADISLQALRDANPPTGPASTAKAATLP